MGMSDNEKPNKVIRTPITMAKGPSYIIKPKSASCLINMGIPDAPQKMKARENKRPFIGSAGRGATIEIRAKQEHPAKIHIKNIVLVLSRLKK